MLKKFGKKVRGLRKAQKLSQENLAEKAGLHYTYIGGIERGERNPSLKNIEKIANALKVTPNEFFIAPQVEDISAKNIEIIEDINRHIIDKDIKILQLIRLLVRDIDNWLKKEEK